MLFYSFLTVLLLTTLVAAADLYKTLDLHKSCNDRDIRQSYKRLSKKFHPDKNKDPAAKDKFVEIARAYEILSDPKKREIYDRYGEEGLKAHEGGQHAQNPFDVFQSFFGGGFTSQQQTRKGASTLTEFEVLLSDMYTGSSIDFNVKKNILCDHCRGSGAASDGDIHTCSSCGGAGIRIVKQQIFPGMFAQSQVTCNDCGGRGTVIKTKCPHCGGNKVVDHVARFTLEVTPGMPEGHEVIFEGESDESPDWEAGDIIIRVRSRKDKGGWRRKESSLYWKETIGVDEALLGFERNLTHLGGHTIRLARKGVTQPGFVQTIKGEGMPIFESSRHGDLFVEYNVVFPTTIPQKTRRKLMDAFREGSTHDEL